MSKMEQYAIKYDRHDLDRLGLFIEMPYLKKLSKDKKPSGKKRVAIPGNMLAGGPKTKCANQDGYFNEEFIRIFDGERKKALTKKKAIPAITPFLPGSPGKMHSTPNDYFGCFFEEPPERFDPKLKGPLGKKKKKGTAMEPANFMTNPVKKGGPGFVDITINPYPEHSKDFYGVKPPKKGKIKAVRLEPFYTASCPQPFLYPNPYFDPKDDPPKKSTYLPPKAAKGKGGKPPIVYGIFIPVGPAKWPGGCHDGTFTPFPEHMKEPYLTPLQIFKFKAKAKGKGPPPPKKLYTPFVPPFLVPKSMQMESVMKSTEYRITSDNWKTYSPTYVMNL